MKKKLMIILLVSLISCILVAGIVLVCVLNLKKESPDKIEIKAENGVITFVTNQTSEEGFVFRIRNNKTDVKINSKFDFLEVDNNVLAKGIEIGQNYRVSVCYSNENGGEASGYSEEVDWTASKFLKAPVVSLASEKIVWSSVESADYYKVFYNPNGSLLSYEVRENELKLEKLFGGVSDVYIVACSNKNYLYNSKNSNIIKSVIIVHEREELVDLSVNSNKELIVNMKENLDSLILCLGSSETNYQQYNLVNLEPQKVGDYYRVVVDISYLYANQTKIGVKPGVDSYNKYSGEVLWKED